MATADIHHIDPNPLRMSYNADVLSTKIIYNRESTNSVKRSENESDNLEERLKYLPVNMKKKK